MGFEPTTPSLGSEIREPNQAESNGLGPTAEGASGPESPDPTTPRLKSALKIKTAENMLDREIAEQMLQLALQGMANRLAIEVQTS